MRDQQGAVCGIGIIAAGDSRKIGIGQQCSLPTGAAIIPKVPFYWGQLVYLQEVGCLLSLASCDRYVLAKLVVLLPIALLLALLQR